MLLSKTVTINNQEITLEVGRYAEQATAAVLAKCGDTVVLVSVVSGRENPGLDYFPLTVEYQEKLFASGIIKGSRWVKREGRPTDEAILKARLIDRSIRPLFPKDYLKEVQVIATVLSYDPKTNPEILALCAASAALAISPIPWAGPIAAARIKNDKLDLIVSGSEEAIVMVEAGAKEVSETEVLQTMGEAHQEIKKVIKTINELVKEVGQKKEEFIANPPAGGDADVKKQILAKTKSSIDDLIVRLKTATHEKAMDLGEIQAAAKVDLVEIDPKIINNVTEDYLKTTLRHTVFTKKIRPDGRKPDEIRPISCEVSVLPRTHGSAMFKRGATQAVTVTTLGSPRLGQLIEDLDGETEKRYIHHYEFPPFSVGECGRVGFPSRREIGHGALAERALEPMIPDENVFPYAIRVVSEIMSSNGSTSMASVCGSTLSLMDAGVPLIKPVAGIAMGLMVEGKDYVVLTDIQGAEDHLGDMDFKVAGTADGITALQMDIKIAGVTTEILEKALDKAKIARLSIMKIMNKTLAEPKKQMSQYAPKIKTLNIPVEKIGELIGPGGRIIKKIIKETECQVDVDDDGRVVITGTDAEKLEQALKQVDGLTREFKVGEEFDGKVVRVEAYGAFVEMVPGRDGLVHVSRLSTSYVADPNTIVKLGQILHVRVREIDEQNRVSLTTLTPEQEQQVPQRPSGGFRPGGFSGGRPPFRRPGGGQRFSGRR
ncbi:MAG: polyribonucleotide nucleotidyltransferase [Candidatus Beckwithbacteria bacterium]|nr:polyribonucleotide nucleotidyltransferase [Candidatus Beckwithbacteria bacterium]